MKPQGREEEDFAWLESCGVWVRIWDGRWSGRIVGEDVEGGAGCSRRELEVGDVGWGIEHQLLRTPNLA